MTDIDIEEAFHGKSHRIRKGYIIPVNIMLLRTRFMEIFDFKKKEIGFVRYEKIQQGELKATYSIFDQENKWLGEVDFSPMNTPDQTMVTYEFDSEFRDLFSKIRTRHNAAIEYYKGYDQLIIQSMPTDKTGTKTRKKKKSKAAILPTYYENAKKWVLAWEIIESLIAKDPTLEVDYDELRPNLKAQGLKFGNETIKKIISWGKSKDVLTLLELDEKHKK